MPLLQQAAPAANKTFNVQLSGVNAASPTLAAVTIVNNMTIPTSSIPHFKTFEWVARW